VDSTEDAYRQLVFLSEKLVVNEGLLLQKTKTRVMSSDEFLSTSDFAGENEPETKVERESRDFMRLRLHYDPYSQSADEDYETLKEEVAQFDVLGMLGREMRKSRVHQSLARKLISSLRLLGVPQRDAALVSLMENLHVLYPVYPSIMILLRAVINEMRDAARQNVLHQLRNLITTGAYVVQVPTHLAYTVRVLAYDPSDEADEILANVYRRNSSAAIRRDVILAMARKNADYWVSDTKKNFATLSNWERTALIVASFTLGDEGKHWRASVKSVLTPIQQLVRDWASARANDGNREVPV